MIQRSQHHLNIAFRNLVEAYGFQNGDATLTHEPGQGYKLRVFGSHRSGDFWRNRGEMCSFLEGLVEALKLTPSPTARGRLHPDYVSLCSLAATRETKKKLRSLRQFTLDELRRSCPQDYRDQIATLLDAGSHPSEVRNAIIGNYRSRKG